MKHGDRGDAHLYAGMTRFWKGIADFFLGTDEEIDEKLHHAETEHPGAVIDALGHEAAAEDETGDM